MFGRLIFSEKNYWEIVDEGIINKINNLTAETQSRMQGTIEKNQ
ncbi:MAG: sporulation stage IV protein A [Eubacterium ventriosum]